MANGLKNYLSFFFFHNTFRNFFYFFLIASSLWLLSRLSDQYTYSLQIPVVYIDANGTALPKSYNTDSLLVEIKASGFKLLKLKVAKPVFKYRLASGKIHQWSPENHKREVQKLLGKKTKIIELQPEKIKIDQKRIFQKKVPVSLQLKVSYKEGYKNTSPPVVKPDHIRIFGKKEILDKIDSISTQKLNLKEISSNVSQKMNLELPEGVKTNYKKVFVRIPVDQLIENEEILPINLPEKKKKDQFLLLPRKSKITYTFFKKDFTKIKNTDLKLGIAPEDLKKGKNKARVILINKIPEILKYKIHPGQVTLLIKNKKND